MKQLLVKRNNLLRKRMIKDDRYKMSLVLFDEFVYDVESNKYYEFKKLRVQKFMNESLLKSNETSTASAIENQVFQAIEDEAVQKLNQKNHKVKQK